MLCCLVLLLVRYLGFITEGNTLPSLCYIIPPSPGKYRRSSSDQQAEFMAPLSWRIFNITRFLITNLISLEFTLFAICLSFSSPPLHKNLPFYSPSFSFAVFLPDLFWVHSCYVVTMTQENTKLCDFSNTKNNYFISTPIAPPATSAESCDINTALLNLVMKGQFSELLFNRREL